MRRQACWASDGVLRHNAGVAVIQLGHFVRFAAQPTTALGREEEGGVSSVKGVVCCDKPGELLPEFTTFLSFTELNSEFKLIVLLSRSQLYC